MIDANHVLISLEERHAENILKGQKHVEFRRRSMDVSNGTMVWIYVKKPRGAVIGCARVSDTYTLALSSLWKRFSQVSGLTRQEYLDYFEGVTEGFVLVLESAARLKKPLSLEVLKRNVKGFHPPQFFMRVSSEGELFYELEKASRGSPACLARS